MLLRRALIRRKSYKLTNVFVSLFPHLSSERLLSSSAGTCNDNANHVSQNKHFNLDQAHYEITESSELERHDTLLQQSIEEQHEKTEKEQHMEETTVSGSEGDAPDKRTSAVNARKAVISTMELAAKARRDIFDLWKSISAREMSLLPTEEITSSSQVNHSASAADNGTTNACDTCNNKTQNDSMSREEEAKELDNDRVRLVWEILNKYELSVRTSRENDVSRGLGDAFERLLLLCVPLPVYTSTSSESSGKIANHEPTAQLETVLELAARNGRQLDVRTVQHLFARTSSFAEALAIFYSLRKCHFAMNMQTYHAMLYSLQRLEEEGWAQRFHEEYITSNKRVLSEQALDFILQGVNNQLLPENKPWLGRVMYAEGDGVAEKRQSMKEYDELGKMWLARYKNENE